MTGAGLGASEVRTPVSSSRCLGGRGRDGDHGGLDGSGGGGVLAPAVAAMFEVGDADDERGSGGVKHERAEEVAAQVVACGVLVVNPLKIGHGCLLALIYCFSTGRVTMLMLVMPACLTASITEAKAPKGTRSSARR